jgi:large subunit ribosomal protein L22
MEIKAKLNYLHITPRKVRLVVGLIKGMDVKEAKTQLKFMPQRVAEYLIKLINSAISNAESNFKIDKEGLFIKQIRVDEGTPFKRWRPVSRGRAFPVLKRTCSIDLILGVKEGFKPKETKETKKEAEQKEIKETKEETRAVSDKIKTKPIKDSKKISKFGGLTKKIFRRKSF